MLWFITVCVVPAFVVTFAATAALRRLAPRWGLVDQPAARKVHRDPTPLGGGIAIWLGVVLPIAAAQLIALAVARSPDRATDVTPGLHEPAGDLRSEAVRGQETRAQPRMLTRSEGGPVANAPGSYGGWMPEEVAVHLPGVLYRSRQMWAILAGGTLLAVMGLIDDLRNLPWLPRLVVQLCVASALVAGGVQATAFVPVPWIGSALTVLWMLVLINAFNFLDNMDALSSGTGLIAAVLFAAVMLTFPGEPRWLVGGVLLVLAGSLGGFLCHNWPPARIFMGDSGSYFLGLLLAAMTVLGTFYEPAMRSRHVILAPLCILAVPLYDFLSVTVIRLREGRSPFHPDRSHFSHRLVELGLKPSHAVLTIHLATLTTGLGGVLLYRVSDWSAAMTVVALIVCVLLIVAILETAGRRNTQRSESSGQRSDRRSDAGTDL